MQAVMLAVMIQKALELHQRCWLAHHTDSVPVCSIADNISDAAPTCILQINSQKVSPISVFDGAASKILPVSGFDGAESKMLPVLHMAQSSLCTCIVMSGVKKGSQ